jgi:hypothetical protein
MKTFYAWDDRVIFLANQQEELIEPEIIRINKAVSSLLQQFKLVSNASSYLRSPGEALDLWISLENRPALQPNWDKMKYFGISDIKPVEICGIPPKVGSEAFQNQIALVRKRANKASISDIQIAQKWADGIGTFSPCGRWNQLIESHIFSSDMSLKHKLRAVSTAQAAMYNAGIACWTVKYSFWVPRPSQVDSSINAHIKIPNFPAYPSGHSCFSWAAVKSLEKDFPSISARLRRFAAEASESRIIAGVHYPMDCAAGKHLGSFIGEKTARSVDSIKRFMKFANGV